MVWTKEAFDDWKSRSGEFFQFLADGRAELMTAWGNGDAMNPHMQSIAQVYGDIIDINYEETVEEFYRKDDEDEE